MSAIVRIVLLAIGGSVAFGIVHNMFTAHICLEYFTIGHVRLFGSDIPALHALAWGIIATWWMGLLLGVPLAVVARIGSWPRLDAADIAPTLRTALLCVFACAALGLIVGWILAGTGVIRLVDSFARAIPAEKHTAFLAVGAAHLTSYAAGTIAGLVLIVLTLLKRQRLALTSAVVPSATAESAP